MLIPLTGMLSRRYRRGDRSKVTGRRDKDPTVDTRRSRGLSLGGGARHHPLDHLDAYHARGTARPSLPAQGNLRVNEGPYACMEDVQGG
jgi:hypothetical protein